ncbi:carbon-nitrogen hydrolase [Coniochaeta ligniaria NRRL 30616]|uniref:Carbon-nitrogen hydrolase n=1 Tax=Coniochaeta ligniaria NRRL 30616 TaxID=1408157 RepID=A0A1J7IRD1_9PEZI|nr:carbon-nitrogen hydrolase [Coniochaeta ligniaria NRRL 30616]
MRIGCLQFAPQVGDVEHNLNRADAVLNRVDPADVKDLDLLVLPEMAFSGYNFKSLEQIMPFLEPSGSGISSLWARTTALKYDCTVAVGYPERVRKEPNGEDFYNSLIVVNGDGETVANYRKSSLYYTDETWAKEGGGFYQGEIQDLGKVAMGICMDINPYKFQTPWTAFEFGFHILTVKANLVIISMAWLTQEDARTFTRLPEEPDMETLTYWVQRLEPIIRAEGEQEIIVVFANRCGVEGDTVYAGTSAVLGVQDGEVSVYGLLGRGSKELLVVNTEMAPFAKLVSRPDGPRDADEQLSPEPFLLPRIIISISISTLLKTPKPMEELPPLEMVTLPRNLRRFAEPPPRETAIPLGFRRLEKSMLQEERLLEMDILLVSHPPETIILQGCHHVDGQTPLGSHLHETCMRLENPPPRSGTVSQIVTPPAHRILSRLVACKKRQKTVNGAVRD